MNKIAVITGASRGIGQALAIELAARKIMVIAISRDEKQLQSLQALNKENIKIIAADITHEQDRNIILDALKNFKINFLINNAGIIHPIGPLHQATENEIKKLFETDLLAPIFLTNSLISYFHPEGGRILNITSVAAKEAVPGIVAYCAAKTAFNMWTAGLKLELPRHIVATTVIPGEVDTHMQGDLRGAPLSQFPLAAEFQAAKQHHTLIPATTCAKFLADILLDTTAEEFVNKNWNIYRDYHKHIPEPLNKKKLAK